MVNYRNGKIYKIENNENDLIYFGSTTQPLYKRMRKHRERRNCKCHSMGVDISECKIVLVENFPCNNKEELTAREAYYIRNFPCVNKVIPGRTLKEWYEENRDKLLEDMKEYREKNKEKMLEQKKEWYEKNKGKLLEKWKETYTCEKCGTTLRKINKARHEKSKKHINSLN